MPAYSGPAPENPAWQGSSARTTGRRSVKKEEVGGVDGGQIGPGRSERSSAAVGVTMAVSYRRRPKPLFTRWNGEYG
jgi:hypothetical protein